MGSIRSVVAGRKGRKRKLTAVRECLRCGREFRYDERFEDYRLCVVCRKWVRNFAVVEHTYRSPYRRY